MSSVDSRIVDMQFKAAAFADGVKHTIDALARLKDSLKLDGASKGLDAVSASAGKNFADINAAAGRTNFAGPLIQGTQTVAASFTAMQAVALTALSNIVNRAINAGLEMSKSLTIAPITSGFDEYELKMGAIQTIMSGSGRSMEEVNAQLKILNDYADDTIYSFGEMTQNIGKFTNAGISLEESVGAIKGVANVAAISGANSEEAARAMRNFAQALSQGYVGLVDWNSIELANMGTVEFKQQLIDASVAIGELTKKGDEYVTKSGSVLSATKGWNLSLQDQWLTTDALTGVLNDYADATTDIGARATAAASDVKTFSQMIDTLREGAGSGWAETWEIIFGNFEEGKSLWTNVNNVLGGIIQSSAQTRNDLLTLWKDGGGRDALIQALSNAWEGLLSILRPIKEAFREIFPAATAQDLIDMSVQLRDFTANLKLSDENAENLKDTFAGIFAIFSIGWQVVKAAANAIIDLLNSVSDMAGGGGGILKITGNIGDFLVRIDELLKSSDSLERFFGTLVDIVEWPLEAMLALAGVVGRLFGGFEQSDADAVTDALDDVQSRLEPLLDLGDLILRFFERLGDLAQTAGEKIGEGFRNIGDWIADNISGANFDRALDVVNTGLLGALVLMIKKFMTGGTNVNIDLSGGLFDTIKESFGAVTETMKNMQANLKADILLKIAIALGIMAASIFLLSTIDSEKLASAMGGLAAGFLGLSISMMKIAGAISYMGTLKLPIVTAALIGLAAALVLIALALKIMSTMDLGDTLQALLAMGGALFIIGRAMKAMPKGMVAQAAALVLLGIGLNAIATALKIFGTMDWDEIGRGLAAMAGSLVAIAGAMHLMPKGMLLQAVALNAVGTALNVIAIALKIFGTIGWEEMGRGLAAMAGTLVIIAGAMHLMPNNMLAKSVALNAVAVALNIMGLALRGFAGMSWEEIGKGLVTLGGSLLILAGGLRLMSGTLMASVALTIAAGALMLLVPVLISLGLLSWEAIIKGLTALAGVFVILGVAGWALSSVVPVIIGLAFGLTLIGLAFALAGAGALMFATAFAIVVAAGAAGILLLRDMLTAFVATIAPAFVALGEGIIGMAATLATGGAEFFAAFTTIIGSILNAIIDNIPKIGELFTQLVLTALDVIVTLAPRIFEAGIQLILGFLQAIANNIGRMITVATDIIVNFLSGISRNLPRIIQGGIDLILAFMRGIGDAARRNGPALADAAMDMAEGLIDGFVSGISRLGSRFKDAILNLAKKAWNSVLDFFGINSPSKKMMWVSEMNVLGLVKGIDKYGHKAVESTTGMGHDIVDAMGKSIAGLGSLVNESMDDLQPVITPVLDLSQIQQDSSQISRLLAEAKHPIKLDEAYSSARTASADYTDNQIAALEAAAEGTTSLEFTQINNSPKALSSAEIYRQTKSQISVAKGALTSVAG